MTDSTQPVVNKIPRCYKHKDRETLVSCGRCGRALCPDCVQHGPVGVRCWECLNPRQTSAIAASSVPDNVVVAKVGALFLAIIWMVVIVFTALLLFRQLPVMDSAAITGPLAWHLLAPNLLLSGVAGGTVGYLQWRLCGRTWNGSLTRWATLLGLAVPIVAAAALTAWILFQQHVLLLGFPLFDLRVVVTAITGGLLSRVFATLPKGV